MKHGYRKSRNRNPAVAPCAGAWIETKSLQEFPDMLSRPLRGGVD